MESKRIVKHIDRLLLDPNNYRFIDFDSYGFISDDKAEDPLIQDRSYKYIVEEGKNNFEVVLNSLKTYGWLDIEPIRVKRLGDKFLVLDGNIRVAALKYIYKSKFVSDKQTKFKESDFSNIEVIEDLREEPSYLLTMKLHPLRKWKPLDQALIIRDLLINHNITESEISFKLGLNKHALRRSQGILALIEEYKDSEFGDQYEDTMYPIFEGLIRHSALREWIEWDSSSLKAANKSNLSRFFGWISADEDFPERTIIKHAGQLYDIMNFIIDELPKNKAVIFNGQVNSSLYFDQVDQLFTQVSVKQYRKIKDVEVKHLNRINLFAGGNNKGKTTLLEIFYILSQLNNIPAFIDLEKYRGKFLSEIHSQWVDKNFTDDILISSQFNGQNVDLKYYKEQTTEDIDRLGYLSTIVSEAKVEEDKLSSQIHLFGNKEPDLRYKETKVLCRAAFTSPYRYNEQLLQASYKIAVENKYKDEIVAFIRVNMDESIQNIELVNDDGESRFRVTSSKFEKAMDITKYGEGLQRIFEIALLLGYCRDGVFCVDEVDGAIHRGLLIPFTDFIHKMACKFNVQVFVSTHSKECIDAFATNENINKDLTAYALNEVDGDLKCQFLKGDKLSRLIDSINIDIR